MLLKSTMYNQREGRAIACVAVIICLLFIFFCIQPVEEDTAPVKATWGWHTTDPPPDAAVPRPSLTDLAAKFSSPKATQNNYHLLYEKYFPALRDEPIKLLEIGLGCEGFGSPPQPRGDGAPRQSDISHVGSSYHTYTNYFSKLSLTYIEPNAECARAFSSRHDKALVFSGDPADAVFLDRFSHESTVHGLFDVVIDDGANASDETQERGLRDLWRVVRPGGVYFVEGIRGWSAGDQGERPFIDFVNGLMWEDLMLPDGEVREVDCMKGICAFFKKG